MSMSYMQLLDQLDAQKQLQAPPAAPAAPPADPGLGVEGDPVLTGLNYAMHAPVVGGGLQAAAGLMGQLGQAPVIGGALNALSYPGQVLRGVLLHDQLAGQTAGTNPLVDNEQSGLQGLQRLISRAGENGLLSALGQAHDDWESLPVSGAKLATDTIVDPANLLGMGMAGKAGRLAETLGHSGVAAALGKADAAEKAAQSSISSRLAQVGTASGEAARAGGDFLGEHVHPFFGTLLQDSPQKAVALENDRGVNYLGHIANFMGTDQGGRLAADLARDPNDPRYAQAAAQVSDRLQALLQAAGAQGAHNLDPQDVVATFQSMLPGFESGHAERLGQALPGLFDQYDRDRQLVDQIVGGLNTGQSPPRTVTEAAHLAEHQGLQSDADLLQKIQTQWKGTDLLAADEDTAVMGRYLRRYSREQGLSGDTNPILKAYREGMTGWKQQALFWPSYYLNNAKDIVFKSEAYMGSPGIADLGHNTAGVVGKFVSEETPRWQAFLEDHPGLQPIADTLQQHVPYQGAVDASRTMGPVWQQFADEVGLRKPPAEILQGGLSNELGGIKGVGGREAQGLERVPGFGRVVQGARELSEALETSARSAAFMDGYQTSLRAGADDTAARMSRVLENGGISPAARKTVEDRILAADGVVSPQRIASWLADAGADDATIADGLREMGGVQTGAYRDGVSQSHKIHLDYRDKTNLDVLLGDVVGFHYWATRNVPRYTEIMATHPGVWASLARLDQDAQQQQDEQGYHSPILNNKVGLEGLGQTLARTLFGREGELFTQPDTLLGIQAPMADVHLPSKGEGPLGRVLDAASSVGVTPNPLIAAGLTVAGAYGARQPSNVLRVTPTVNAAVQQATGQQFDLEAPLHTLERQRPLNAVGAAQPTPVEPADLVRWRLRELSQEATGRPNAPAYAQAQAEGPGNPLWQEAVRSLGSQGVRERALGAIGLPANFYSEAQHQLDQKKRTA